MGKGIVGIEWYYILLNPPKIRITKRQGNGFKWYANYV